MKLITQTFAVGLATLLLVGCGGSSKKELPPAELEKITAEVELERVWKRNIGVGQGELYTNLQPALDGLTLYAADANGRVVSMDRDTGKVNWQVKLKEPLSGAVGAGGGRVMVGTLNGAMITLDENDGSELWRTQVSSEVQYRRAALDLRVQPAGTDSARSQHSGGHSAPGLRRSGQRSGSGAGCAQRPAGMGAADRAAPGSL